MSKLSPRRVAVRMGFFAAGIALLGPAGGALFVCLEDAVPYIKDLWTLIEKQSPNILKKIVESGSDVFKGFWGERLGDAKSEYNQLKNATINFHLSGAILEIWEQEFSTIGKSKKDEIDKIDSELYVLIKESQGLASNPETLEEEIQKKPRN